MSTPESERDRAVLIEQSLQNRGHSLLVGSEAGRHSVLTGPTARIATRSTLAVAGALLLGALLIRSTGHDVVAAYKYLFEGSFGSLRAISETLSKAAPLIVMALGVAICFRARVFNIGAEGQLYMGALAAAIVGTWIDNPWFAIPLLALVAALAGAIWALIPAFLKTRLHTNEIISTLMLNYVAVFLVSYLVSGPLRDPSGGAEPQTIPISESSRLPMFMRSTRLHIGILIALVLVGLFYVIMTRTSWGLAIRSIGTNAEAARRLGVSVGRQILTVMVVAGVLAGLAGYFEVAGRHYRMITGIGGSMGLTAIVIALLGRLHPIGVFVAAILFSGLDVGASTMTQFAGVPAALARVLQASIILFVLVGESFTLWGRRK